MTDKTQSASDIRISGLRKSFGSNEVLCGLDLTITGGDFVGLVGPNGAGKSTLIKILAGIYTASSGDIHYGSEKVDSLASRPEVGFIHQDLGLIDDLSISENLRLGQRALRRIGPILNHRSERDSAVEALSAVGLNTPVDTPVGLLSPAEKTLVAIARTLQRGARVLFVDEATSTLPPGESDRLIDALRHTAESGSTIIMVSHKLSEILRATQRVVVLIDGEVAADRAVAGLDRAGLTSMLVLREQSEVADVSVRPVQKGEEVLRLEGVGGGLVSRADLVLKSGEVVGITGLPGSGLHDIAYLVHGALKPRAGRIVRPRRMRSGLIPPHRETQGGFLEQSVLENVSISSLSRWRSPIRLLRKGKERRDVEGILNKLSVTPSDPDSTFSTLSGGNKQKAIFGRILLQNPDVYVLCEPTRGVDIDTRREVYDLIGQLAADGSGVLVISSDSEDLFAVCERIAVIIDGKLEQFVSTDGTSPEEFGAFI